MSDTIVLKTDDDIRMMTDPYRMSIIRIFSKYEPTPITVKDVADAMQEPHGKVYYHIKKLHDFGALRLDHTEKIKGFVAKYYALNFKHLDFDYRNRDNVLNKDLIMSQMRATFAKTIEETKKDLMTLFDDLQSIKQELQEKDISEDKIRVMTDVQLSHMNLHFSPDSYKTFLEDLLTLLEKHETPVNHKDSFEKEVMVMVYPDAHKIRSH